MITFAELFRQNKEWKGSLNAHLQITDAAVSDYD